METIAGCPWLTRPRLLKLTCSSHTCSIFPKPRLLDTGLGCSQDFLDDCLHSLLQEERGKFSNDGDEKGNNHHDDDDHYDDDDDDGSGGRRWQQWGVIKNAQMSSGASRQTNIHTEFFPLILFLKQSLRKRALKVHTMLLFNTLNHTSIKWSWHCILLIKVDKTVWEGHGEVVD